MPRFLLHSLLFALLQALLLGGLLRWRYDLVAENPLYAATAVKHRRLQDAPSPRVILVGGSNLLFGIDSERIEEETDHHPVNMGLIGGLRLEYMLSEVEASVRHGDLVVLSIEYNSLNAPPNDSNLEVALGTACVRPANLAYLSWPQWRQVLDDEALRYAGVVFRAALGNLVESGDIRRRRAIQGRQVLESVNAYGDLTRYHASGVPLPREANNQQTLGRMLPERVSAKIRLVNRFARRCAERGARVVFAAAPVPESEFERYRNVVRQYERLLRDELVVPIVLGPAEAVFPDDGFIGRSYHLHGDSVRARTQRLIEALLRSGALRPAGARPSPPEND